MGYSKAYFWRLFERYFGKSPVKVLIEMKKYVLVNHLKKFKNSKNGRAARRIHLVDGNGLYQFVVRHFGCTPTELKNQLIQ